MKATESRTIYVYLTEEEALRLMQSKYTGSVLNCWTDEKTYVTIALRDDAQ